MIGDQIRKQIVLKASRERVWQAISDSKQFGTWFGVDFDGPFKAGAWLDGWIVPTKVDPEVAKLQEPHAGTPFKILVKEIVPMDRFVFRWHPYAIDKTADYEKEPTTLVTFALSDAAGGVLLTITESGFNAIPASRRDEAFTSNEGGWEHQCKLIEKYLAQN